MKNEFHYINIPVKEIEFMKFYDLIGTYALCKGNISKAECKKFNELFDIMIKVLEELKHDENND